jgi:nicotinate phosphoribosyltransferase
MLSALATDLYQITMMAGYYASGQTAPRTFELFVRGLPEGRQYLMAAGLEQALDFLTTLRFTADEIAWLRALPALGSVPPMFFDDYLAAFTFTGDVWALEEGEVFFGHEPIVRVTAPAAEAQLVETALLAIITFQTSVASKASRVVTAAAGRSVIEFGSRRAHGPDAAVHAARAAYIAGCASTSNVEAGRRFGVPVSGTMAHSWVMGFANEIDAFRQYMAIFGEHSTLLIDTYDTLAAARRIVQGGLRPSAVRIDSGDLAALAREVRNIFDAGGLTATKILVSGDLDEWQIETLLSAGAPIDGFGVGTAISTVRDAPGLGGVYKLVETMEGKSPRPTIKLSTGKRTYPGRKQVWRVTEAGIADYDVLALDGEAAQDGRPLLVRAMRQGVRVLPAAPIEEIRQRALERVAQLPASLRAMATGPPYPVRISPALDALVRSALRPAAT